MSHGKDAARDLRYGRRGGRWAQSTPTTATGPPCERCGKPMLDGQENYHRTCRPPEPKPADPDQLRFDL